MESVKAFTCATLSRIWLYSEYVIEIDLIAINRLSKFSDFFFLSDKKKNSCHMPILIRLFLCGHLIQNIHHTRVKLLRDTFCEQSRENFFFSNILQTLK